ncbi:DNA polymerase III subunit gamma/tau [Mycoplasmatota bacterium WC30]
MSYKALYRIYRPIDFNEVAGQVHITTTLKNALANDKVAHAYLFSGPRGTGKTSIAKIFAKAVNCVHAPTENPCNECENCKGIHSGAISDVIEIDAASNNGVDEIREIRDKVKYLPGYVKYKVYIIDEVHMLSTGAFNALLKTLEEPPAHVIFILCTTEPQKIPLTILSRCQRFDFKAITTKDIIGKLNEIIEKEKIIIDSEAVSQIAIHAEGALRDAISMLDQANAYSPEHISADDVNQISGAVSLDMRIELAKALIEGDSTKAIEILNSLITEGKEVRKIALNLIEFYRDILMMKNIRKLDESNLLYQNEKFIQLSKMIGNKKTFHILDILNKVLNDIKWSNSPKIYLELAFIKITDNEVGGETRIISIIDDLENRLLEVEKIKDEINSFRERESKEIIQEIINEETKPIIKEEVEPIIEQETKPITKEEIKSTITEETKPVIEEEKDLLENIEIEEEPVDELPFENIPNEIKIIEEKLCDDLDDTYSIAFVEKVLNNGNRDDKNTLINTWDRLRRQANNDEEKHIAQILETGKIVASSVSQIIIAFPSASICNKLMTPSNKKIALNILKNNYQRDIDYIALPDDVFKEIVEEFTTLWKQGKRVIKLSKIKCDTLKNVSKAEETEETEIKSKIVTDAIDLFGDIVKVKN